MSDAIADGCVPSSLEMMAGVRPNQLLPQSEPYHEMLGSRKRETQEIGVPRARERR